MKRFCVLCGQVFTDQVGFRATCSQACDYQWEAESHKLMGDVLRKSVANALDVLGIDSLDDLRVEHKPVESKQQGSLVYFIQGDNSGAVKIGITTDLDRRLRELQVATAETLAVIGQVPGGREMERELHERFKDQRLTGEWFVPSGDLLAYIATV